jgi:hypothetical protein
MGDPELAARAQAAAERLERSWDRWRRQHGLAAEQAQPVSSYVGYSLAEPWGRARVVFGVGAEEAEQLSALLEQDSSADSRFSQGLLWEQSAPGPQDSSAQPQADPANGGQFGGGQASPGQFAAAPVPASPVNGAPSGDPGNGARFPGGNGQPMVNGSQIPAGPPPEASVPEARQGDEKADTDPAAEWAKNMPTFQPAPTAPGTSPRDRGVPEAIRADLAGWTSGELPGQASAGLAAWPAADTAQADVGPHKQAGAGPDGREAGPGRPGNGSPDPAAAGPGTSDPAAVDTRSPDPAAWLRLALLGPEPLLPGVQPLGAAGLTQAGQ